MLVRPLLCQRRPLTQTFTNNSEITINDGAPATPYPSTIAVSGLTGSVVDVNVTLHDLSHTCNYDVEVLLVGPVTKNVLLMHDVGACSNFTATVTFDDEVATVIPEFSTPTTGAYKPSVAVSESNPL